MPGYLIRKAKNDKEDDVKQESKHRKNPETCGWIKVTPFSSLAWVYDCLDRLPQHDNVKVACERYKTTAFIDLTRFVSEDDAIERTKKCLTWIQQRLPDVPSKWGQSSCNLSPVHPLQLRSTNNPEPFLSDLTSFGMKGSALTCVCTLFTEQW